MTERKNVEALRIHMSGLDCPHCDRPQDGWLVDPRGSEHQCDECGLKYFVPQDVKLLF